MSKTPRFFFSDAEYSKGKYYLHDADIIRHARKVLRLGKGDRVELFDGKGMVYTTEIELLSKELLIVNLLEQSQVENENRLKVTLAQALPKVGKIDNILRMNTEIGVSDFVLFESDYSVVKIKDYHEGKLTRLNKIVREAARQSHNDFLPSIFGPVEFKAMIAKPADLKIILHTDNLNMETVSLSDIKSELKGEESVTLCVGPEGGFSKEEIEFAQTQGFRTVKLNLPVLRTETAGLVASAFSLI